MIELSKKETFWAKLIGTTIGVIIGLLAYTVAPLLCIFRAYAEAIDKNTHEEIFFLALAFLILQGRK